METKQIRTGFIGLVGPTNSGKSTLLNCLVGREGEHRLAACPDLEREGEPAVVLLNFWDRLSAKERKQFLHDSDFASYLNQFKTSSAQRNRRI